MIKGNGLGLVAGTEGGNEGDGGSERVECRRVTMCWSLDEVRSGCNHSSAAHWSCGTAGGMYRQEQGDPHLGSGGLQAPVVGRGVFGLLPLWKLWKVGG